MSRPSANRRQLLLAGGTGLLGVTLGQVHDPATTAKATENAIEISDWSDLDNIRDDLHGNYLLANDLDTDTPGYEEVASPSANNGSGFEPIGDWESPFTGAFDGNGNTIQGLAIDRPNEDTVGLFGATSPEAELAAVTLIDTDVSAEFGILVGGLVGENAGTITESSVEGTITGEQWVGGLTGSNEGKITDSHVGGNTTITGDSSIGGITGSNVGELYNSHYNIDTVEVGEKSKLTAGGLFDQQYQEWQDNGRELFLEDYPSLNVSGTTVELDGPQAVRDALGFIDDADLSWELTTDLDLTGDNSNLYLPEFTGELDGNGHTVAVDIDGSAIDLVGFIGHNHGLVSNIKVTGSITGDRNAGGLTGQNSGTITDSVTDCEVSAGSYTGGVVGHNSGEVVNTSTRSKVIDGNYAGGLIGVDVDGLIEQSLVTGDIDGSEIGGLVGIVVTETVARDSYWDTRVTGSTDATGEVYDDGGIIEIQGNTEGLETEEMQGESAETNMPGLDFEQKWHIVANPDGYPILYWQEKEEPEGPQISDWFDLDAIREFPGWDYELIEDLDRDTNGYVEVAGPDANDEKGFDPIDEFTGTLEGNNHTIRGLVVDRPDESQVGLFGRTDLEAEVREINLEEIDITGSSSVGGLVGQHNEGIIADVSVTGESTGGSRTGGLVGRNESTITGVESKGIVHGDGRDIGGLVGENRGTITGATAEVTVDSQDDGSIWDAGGLVGTNRRSAEVNESEAMGDVTGDRRVGGFAGRNIEGSITDVSATGDVNGRRIIGGLVGTSYGGTITRATATGDVKGADEGDAIGGLAGGNGLDNSIIEAIASGDVSGDTGVGGLVGKSAGEISETIATGNISGDEGVGGLVGQIGSDDVPAEARIVLRDSYWNEQETNIQDAVGRIEESDATVEINGDIEGLETGDMQGESAEATMTALDFEQTWEITTGPDDYPVLNAEQIDDPEDDMPADDEDSGEEGIYEAVMDGMPGFGIGETIAAVGGAAYLLRRRFTDDKPED